MLELREVEEEPIELGEVYLDHDILVIDPCYDNIGYGAEVHLPLQGMYKCYYTKDEEFGCIASIWVVLSQVNEVIKSDEIGCCGVDSGQLGIFNKDKYEQPVSEKEFAKTLEQEFRHEDWKRTWDENDEDAEKFYKACCNLTLNTKRLGILEGVGFVSASGCGDGCYPVYRLEGKDGTKVGVRIDFIENDEESC